MASNPRWRPIVTFVGVYLSFAVPPYLVLNWDVVVEVSMAVISPSTIVGVFVFGIIALAALVRASEGVYRYTQFLAAPTDWLSLVIVFSFLLGAVSWWAVPELVLESQGRVSLELLYFLVFLAHVPMLVFLSLMTALGFAQPD